MVACDLPEHFFLSSSAYLSQVGTWHCPHSQTGRCFTVQPTERIKTTIFLNSEVSMEFQGIEIAINRFTKMDDEAAWVIHPHAHMNYELHYIYAGAGEIGLGGNTFDVAAGEFYVCPPFVDHSQRAKKSDPMKEYCIECSLSLREDTAELSNFSLMQTISRILYCPHSDTSGILKRNFKLLEEMFTKDEQMDDAEELLAKSLFLNTIMSILLLAKRSVGESEANRNQKDVSYQRATSIRNYLEANYKQNITVKDCARIFYLSERQIDRILKKVYDETFHQMLARTRVNIAVNLMKNTDLPAGIVALEAGFSGYRQMLRSFRRFGTEQPTKLRKESKEYT